MNRHGLDFFRRHGGAAEVAGISGNAGRQLAQVLFYPQQYRHQLLLIIACLDDGRRHDDLRLRINSELRVVSLDESVSRMILHHPRFNIGEVAPRFGLRQRLFGIRYLSQPTGFLAALFSFAQVRFVFLL